jgi:hypothetical protein
VRKYRSMGMVALLAGSFALAGTAAADASLSTTTETEPKESVTAGASADPQLIDNQPSVLLTEMHKQERWQPAAQMLLETAARLPETSGYAGAAFESDGITLY